MGSRMDDCYQHILFYQSHSASRTSLALQSSRLLLIASSWDVGGPREVVSSAHGTPPSKAHANNL